MDLTFKILMQYCSLQHQTLLSPPDTSTTGHHFCFGTAASFILKLFLIVFCSSPVVSWTSSDLGGSSSGVISFCLLIPLMRFSQQEFWSDFPFCPPVDHFLSQLSTMTRLSWLVFQSMAQSFIELHRPITTKGCNP